LIQQVAPDGPLLLLFIEDITDREGLKLDLRETKGTLEKYLDLAAEIVVTLDGKGKITSINRGGCRLLGYKKEELLGKSWFAVCLPVRLRKDVEAVFRKVMKGEMTPGNSFENPVLRKDGSERTILWHNAYIEDDRGGIIETLSTGEDITERKNAEAAIKDREELLNEVGSIAKIGGWEMDMETGEAKWTRGTYDIVEIAYKDPVPGMNEHVDFYFPEYRKMIEQKMKELVETRKPIQFEAMLKTAKGNLKWCRAIGKVVEKDGKIIKLKGTFKDITEQKKASDKIRSSEQRLREMMDNIPGAVYRCANDEDWTMEFLSKKFFDWTGYKVEDLIDGKKIAFADLIHADDSLRVWDCVQKALDKKSPYQLEYRMRMPDGSYRWLWEKGRGVFSEAGKLLYLEGIFLDVDDRKQAEEELVKYRKHLEDLVEERTAQLQESNNELKDFAYVVSHDLKAPLRAISQLSYWLSQDYEDALDDKGKELLAMIGGRVKRLDSLIDGILLYSRVGKAREKETNIDLNVLVREVIESLAPPPHIDVRIEGKLPVYRGDATRFTQLFQNLLGNAVKFMDKSEGKVEIGCGAEGDFWKFRISDNGPGIEKRYHEKIFRIFQTLKSRDKQEGTGVGLTLVKRLISIYKGQVWLESEIGIGSTFYFTLPKQEK